MPHNTAVQKWIKSHDQNSSHGNATFTQNETAHCPRQSSTISVAVTFYFLMSPDYFLHVAKEVFSLEESLESLKSLDSPESLENGWIFLCFPQSVGSLESLNSLESLEIGLVKKEKKNFFEKTPFSEPDVLRSGFSEGFPGISCRDLCPPDVVLARTGPTCQQNQQESVEPVLHWVCPHNSTRKESSPNPYRSDFKSQRFQWETDFYPMRVLGGVVLAQ